MLRRRGEQPECECATEERSEQRPQTMSDLRKRPLDRADRRAGRLLDGWVEFRAEEKDQVRRWQVLEVVSRPERQRQIAASENGKSYPPHLLATFAADGTDDCQTKNRPNQ